GSFLINACLIPANHPLLSSSIGRSFWPSRNKVTRNLLNRRLDMKRYVPSILAAALLVFKFTAIDIHAQSPRAKAHMEAARALAYEPGQDFTSAFAAVCVKPQPLAAEPPVLPQNVPPKA